jgi:hypothetical protein
MADEAGTLVTILEARTADYDRALARSGQVTQQYGTEVERAAGRAEGAMVQSLGKVNEATGNASASQMILQSVVRRTADQFAAGAPLSTIFAEHISAIAEAGQLAGGSMGAFGEILSGPWGIAISAAISVLSIFGAQLLDSGEAADGAEKSLKAFEDRQADLARFVDATTGKLREQNRQLALIAQMQFPAQINAQAGVTRGFTDQAFNAAREFDRTPGAGTTAARVAVAKAVDASGSNVQLLNRNLAALADRNPELKALADQVAGLAGQAAEAALKIGTMQGQQRDLNTALQGGVVVTTSLIDRQVAIQQATNGVELAQARLNDVRARGAEIDKMDSGAAKTAALGQYRADLAGAESAVKSEQAAEEAARKARADAAAEARRQAAQRLRDLLDYVETVRKLGSEEGLIPDLMKSNAQLGRTLGLDDAEATLKGIGTEIDKIRETTILDPSKQALQQQEQSIRTLSGLYYDLFTGGTKSLWKDFERMGLEALAKIAAEKTFAALLSFGSQHSGDGGILGTIATAVSSFGGPRAAGGPVAAGGTYLVGEKGPELLQMGASAGTIVPNQAPAMRPSMGQVTGGTVEHRIVIEPNEMFDTHVDTRVVGGIVQYAPVIIEGAKSATFAAANRPSLPRSAG